MSMKKIKPLSVQIDARALKEARYIINRKCTVRQVAKALGISKSSVHKDLTMRLPNINYNIYSDVRKILDKNKAERHIRGGIATRKKFQKLKTKNK